MAGRWESTLPYRVLGQPTTDRTGRFRVTLTVPVVDPGSYQVVAEGQTSFASASTHLMITG